MDILAIVYNIPFRGFEIWRAFRDDVSTLMYDVVYLLRRYYTFYTRPFQYVYIRVKLALNVRS